MGKGMQCTCITNQWKLKKDWKFHSFLESHLGI